MIYCSFRMFESVIDSLTKLEYDLDFGVYYYPFDIPESEENYNKPWFQIILKKCSDEYKMYGKIYVLLETTYWEMVKVIVHVAEYMICLKSLDEEEFKQCITYDQKYEKYFVKVEEELPDSILKKIDEFRDESSIVTEIFANINEWINFQSTEYMFSED